MQNCCPVLHILFSGRGSQTLLAYGHLNVFGMVHKPMFLENLIETNGTATWSCLSFIV